MARCDEKVANIWVARFMPVLLTGIMGYVSWVFVGLLCLDYLLRPTPTNRLKPRPTAAIAFITTYFILFLPMIVTYFRILYIIATNPGYVPRGRLWYEQREKEKHGSDIRRRRKGNAGSELTGKSIGHSWNDYDGGLELGNRELGKAYPANVHSEGRTDAALEPGLEQFYTKDVFVCQDDGYPIWCSTCLNYKPDRTHHCSEVGRCVRKMDHFCPWVGGIVSETNFKFFVQFVTQAAIYWVFVLIVLAFFVAERQRLSGQLIVHWIVVLGLAGLLGFFAAGMTGSSLQFLFINTTTIENLSRKTKVWQLAVLIPEGSETGNSLSSDASRLPFSRVTYPRLEGGFSRPSPSPRLVHSSNSLGEGRAGNSTNSAPALRSFAIVRTRPGENPWDLGLWRNFKSVMGEHWWDWILPIKYSPICKHDSGTSHFPIGRVVDRLRREADLLPVEELSGTPRRHSSHRKRRHSVDVGGQRYGRHSSSRKKHKQKTESLSEKTTGD